MFDEGICLCQFFWTITSYSVRCTLFNGSYLIVQMVQVVVPQAPREKSSEQMEQMGEVLEPSEAIELV